MPVIKRVAFLSLHTSPMEQPGSGDAGGSAHTIGGRTRRPPGARGMALGWRELYPSAPGFT